MPHPEDRAASEVIGAVILFGFLVITFSIYQGIVVPNQNRGIEFDHNQDVQDSVQDLRNAIRQTARTGAEESVSINLGPSYPQRVIAINPGAGGGSLQTQSLGTIALQNISATDEETADYFGTTTTTLGAFQSKTVIYSPLYFQYQQAPTTHYENTLAFNQFPGGTNLTITSQAVIDDRKITLIAVEGNVSEARQDTVTIDTNAISTATNTVSVTNKSGPINITIGTRLSAVDWNDTLEGELKRNGGHVIDVRQTGTNQVSIILEGNPTYDLRLAKVGVGTGTTAEGPKYIVDVEGDDTSVIENGTQKLVVEVRDRFNNPVSNVTVDAQTPSEGTLDSTTDTTEADGQATFVYTAPADIDGPTDVSIDMSFDGDGTANETVTFSVKVLDADGSGGGGDDDESGTDEINPAEVGDVHLDDEEHVTGGTVRLTYVNTGDTNISVSRARISFYYDAQGGGMTSAELSETGSGVVSLDMVIGDRLEDLNPEITFPGNDTPTQVDVDFNDNAQSDDFYIMSLEFSNGEVGTYFIGLQ